MALLCWSLLVFVLWASSGSTARTVQGIVTDQDDNRLDHAVVQIEDPRRFGIRSYITQSDGSFHFAGLRRDMDYELTAEFDGVRSNVKRVSKVDARDDAEVWLRIRLGR